MAIDLVVTTYNCKVVGVSMTSLCKPDEDARVGVPVCGLRHVHRSGKDVDTGVRVYGPRICVGKECQGWGEA